MSTSRADHRGAAHWREYRIRCNTHSFLCHKVNYRHFNLVAGEGFSQQEQFCVMARRSVTLANQVAGVVGPMLAESGPHARRHTWVSADSITRDPAETAQSGSPWFGRDFIADSDGLLHGPRCSTAGPAPPADSHDHQLPDVPTLASTCA